MGKRKGEKEKDRGGRGRKRERKKEKKLIATISWFTILNDLKIFNINLKAKEKKEIRTSGDAS